MLTILGILFFSFGLIEFTMLFVSASQDQTGRYIDQKPLYTTNGIAVDSKGYLYYGIREFNTIQVYDNTGVFMYRFSFGTGGAGYFVFIIDDEDIVHVATARQNCIYSYQNGDLINTYQYVDVKEESDTIDTFRGLQRDHFMDEYGNRYIVEGRTIEIYNSNGALLRSVTPKAPVWPFPFLAYWIIMSLGMFLIFLSNMEFFEDFRSEFLAP
jgi:hypothetical protein